MVRETKQMVLDEVTDLLGLARWVIPKGQGSSLPKHVFQEAASRVGVQTGNMPEVAERVIRKAGRPWFPDYDSRATPSRGGSTVTLRGLRAFADALGELLGSFGHSGVLLAWNPAERAWPSAGVADLMDATAQGQLVSDVWPVDLDRFGFEGEERVFLMRRGVEPEGIVATGWLRGKVDSDPSSDDSPLVRHFVGVEWDAVIDLEKPLAVDRMDAATGAQRLFLDGCFKLDPFAVAGLEELWAQHLKELRPPSRGQARFDDAERRKKIEDAAQERLMTYFRDLGWEVSDRRIGNPFDALAAKDGDVRYLEAKGTTSRGETVIVTRNEVRWARTHPGEHVIGVWSGMEFDASGDVDPGKGDFKVFEWIPEDEHLAPIAFDWTVGGVQIHP